MTHKDLRNASLELGTTPWRAGQLRTCASRHLATRVTMRASHGNDHHARERLGLDLKHAAHAVYITRQLTCAAHASLSTSHHAVHIFRIPRRDLCITSRQHTQHARITQSVSNPRRSRPQPRPSVLRQHSGCAGHGGSKPLGLGRPPPPVAPLQQRLSASP